MSAAVSILMPNRNAFPFLQEAVNGIIQQSFTNWHLHIIDDASSDESIPYLASIHHPSIQVTFLREQVGPEAIINTYLQAIETEYFAITDADDVWHPDKLMLQIKFLEENQDHLFCGTAYYTINENGFITKRQTLLNDWNSIKQHAQHHAQFLAGTIVYRKKAAALAQPFFQTNNLEGYGDMLLIYTLLQSYPCSNLPQLLYAYRILASSRSRQNLTPKKLSIYSLIVRNQFSDFKVHASKTKDQFHFHAAFYHLYWCLPGLAYNSAKQGLKTRFSILNFFRFLYILFNIGLLKTKQSFNKTHYSTLFAHS